MRYESKKDAVVAIAIWAVVSGLVLATALSPPEIRLWIALSSLGGIAFVLWIYYGTYYELRADHIYARSGPFVERVYYDLIIEAKPCKNFYSSMALSTERIFVRTTRKGLMGMTYISPVNREEFLAELKSRCPNLRD